MEMGTFHLQGPRSKNDMHLTTRHLQAAEIAHTIELAKLAGVKTGPLVIVGYSTGAYTACDVANRLAQTGIPIDLLVTIDPPPTSNPRVPPNVRHCFNYYETNVRGILLLSGSQALPMPPDWTSPSDPPTTTT